ncbi:hypothetical protein SLEP1_g17652 [Rubroshorea leprosula]|uniref:Uncharacterized protein n=1 Tax=Rubroshorea leprosula TaxID=152421 RepID=A0AAV5IYM0_9ROSI|nr:hypothetical protein SLEP1_g17652 [Rubroshorea leprosula]
MADMSIIEAMDRLWFHRIILFSEPISQDVPKTLKPHNNLSSPTSSISVLSLPEAEILEPVSLLEVDMNFMNSSLLQFKDDSNKEDEVNEIKEKNRPWRTHSNSSSPTQKRPKNFRYSGSGNTETTLSKSITFRRLRDLEFEEVKGFMDLGFIFKKEHLNPRMMSVIPGLQRLNKNNTEEQARKDEDDTEQDQDKRSVTRPYLSEAWPIKRPNSPLLNLKHPRVFAGSDMKKHLRFWARAVASEIRQES